MRDYPKYVVEWQTSFDNERMTPAEAGVEALRELRAQDAAVIVYDVDTHRHWDVRFRDHVLEIIELHRVELKLPGME